MRGQPTRKREHIEEPSSLSKLFNIVYVIILIVVAFFVSGLALDQAKSNDIFDPEGITLPVIDQQVPTLVIQLILAVFIFFVLQFFSVFIFGLFKGDKKDAYDPMRDQWGRN